MRFGTATMRLKAIFPNPNRLLWPNQFVKARLLLTVRKGALVIRDASDGQKVTPFPMPPKPR